MTLQIVQDEAADDLISSNPFALLCGMLLDQQQVDPDVAFAGPARILERLGALDPEAVADAPADDFARLFAAEPPIHPFPESMSVLAQALAKHVVVNYGGDAASIWLTAWSGEHLLSRLIVLPGFETGMAQEFIALLGRRLGVQPDGWEDAAGRYAAPDGFRSVADVHDPESLARVKQARAAGTGNTEAGTDVDEPGDQPGRTYESKGQDTVNTDDEQSPATGGAERRPGAKKSAAKKGAAKKAAGKKAPGKKAAAKKGAGRGQAGKGPAKKAAKRAAAKARLEELQANDPEAAKAFLEARAAKRAARKAAGSTPTGDTGSAEGTE